jgi:hypothetical protein
MLANAVRLMKTSTELRTRILRVYAFLLVFNVGACMAAGHRGIRPVPDPPPDGASRVHVRAPARR